MSKYRIVLMSTEARAASSPNIIYLDFASDGDAETFGSNFDIGTGGICVANNVAVDLELSTNYAIPYPAGTEYSGRLALGDAAGFRQNVPFSNVPAGFVPSTRVSALLGLGWLMPGGNETVGPAPTYGNCQIFVDQPSI